MNNKEQQKKEIKAANDAISSAKTSKRVPETIIGDAKGVNAKNTSDKIRKSLQKPKIIYFLIIAIFAIIVLISLSYSYLVTKSNNKKTEETAKVKVIVKTTVQTTTPENFENNVKYLNKGLQSTTDNKQKLDYLIGLSNLTANNGKLAEALIYAQQANKIERTALTNSLIGDIAMDMQNYPLAVQSFKDAVSLSEKTNPNERSPYNDYLIMQKEAEAKL